MQNVLAALSQAAQQNPDMAPYLEFQRALLELQSEAGAKISGSLELADQADLQARTLQGLPLLSWAQLPVEPAGFSELATAITQLLGDNDPDLARQEGPTEAAEWVSLAQERFQEGRDAYQNREAEEVAEEEATLAEMAVTLALQPYLRWAAQQVLPHVDQEHWKRSYCPVCGGAPDFAFLDKETGARHLVCSRCDSTWLYRRLGCPFCGSEDYTQLFYYASDDGVYRLYVCQVCHRYLKAIDLRKATHQVILPAERITSVAMDVAAQQEGYRSSHLTV